MQLARRTTGACERIEALVGLTSFYHVLADRSQRGIARARRILKACVLRLLFRDSERRRTAVPLDTRRWPDTGGHSWHVAPRPRAKGEKPLSGALPFSNYGHDSPLGARFLVCMVETKSTQQSWRPTQRSFPLFFEYPLNLLVPRATLTKPSRTIE